jgi:hypothetical protein
VYAGSEEGPADLELTRDAIRRLQIDPAVAYGSLHDVTSAENLDPDRVAEHVRESFEDSISADTLDLSRVSDGTISELIDIATGDEFADVLAEQREYSRQYLPDPE